jgi:uncharacterized protein (DUF58 family)
MNQAPPVGRALGRQAIVSRLTRDGWLWLMLAAALGLVGYLRAMNLITLVALILGVILGVNFVAARRALRGVQFAWKLDGPLFARRPAPFEIHITSDATVPAISLRVEEHGPDHVGRWFLPFVHGEFPVPIREELTPRRRGWYYRRGLRVSTGHPFGLVESVVCEPTPPRGLLVYPSVGRLDIGAFRRFLRHHLGGRERSQNARRRHPAAQSEFHGLRDYRPGDSPRAIHWRSSARWGTLLVREYEDDAGHDLVLILDPTVSESVSAHREVRDDFEAVVSFAATVCHELAQVENQRQALVVAHEGEPLIVASQRIDAAGLLECLALVEPCRVVDRDKLLAALDERRLTGLPAVVVGVAPWFLHEALAARAPSTVVGIAAADLNSLDFYEVPTPS